MKTFKALLVVAVGGAIVTLGLLYSGLYPIGADAPHTAPTYWLLETLRERSIAASIQDIHVPPLDDSKLLLDGGADYNEMCAGCHMKPGMATSEISMGLYPRPPNLAMSAGRHGDTNISAARQFWIIKHGIKASGMAAFGPTHDDARIWAMVAFLQKLPTLTPAQYQIITSREDAGMDHDE